MRKRAHAVALSSPSTAAHPTSTGNAPAAPPMTMFCGDRRFSPRVYTPDVPHPTAERQGGGEQVDPRGEEGERGGSEREREGEHMARRHATARDRTTSRTPHHRVDVAVDEHVGGVRASGHQVAAEHRPDGVSLLKKYGS